MSMPKTYIAHEDVDGLPDIDADFGLVIRRRVQGPPVVLEHSQSDLRLHRLAGAGAAIIAVLMLIAILGVVLS